MFSVSRPCVRYTLAASFPTTANHHTPRGTTDFVGRDDTDLTHNVSERTTSGKTGVNHGTTIETLQHKIDCEWILWILCLTQNVGCRTRLGAACGGDCAAWPPHTPWDPHFNGLRRVSARTTSGLTPRYGRFIRPQFPSTYESFPSKNRVPCKRSCCFMSIDTYLTLTKVDRTSEPPTVELERSQTILILQSTRRSACYTAVIIATRSSHEGNADPAFFALLPSLKQRHEHSISHSRGLKKVRRGCAV